MKSIYWDQKAETMSIDERRVLQSERLRKTVNRVWENVPSYRRKMQNLGLEPGDIQTIDDIVKLPFTTKEDLRDNYPYGLFAVPMNEIIRIHSSSGTTGKPTVVGYTKNDIALWGEMVARCLYTSGVTAQDVVQVSYGYGLFTGGLGLHYGAERVGASVIPASGGNSKKQAMMMKDFGVTALACTPSYALHLGETVEKMGYDKKDLSMRVGIFGAEPWTEEMRARIEDLFGLEAHDIYGLSEIMGPGVAISCNHRRGIHIFDDHFYPEIIDPDTLAVQPAATSGELVISTITKEGLPLLRYRTRDITMLFEEPCSCGRTHVRMDKISGRSDDMLIIRGVNVFPSQIESVLLEESQVAPHYHLIIDRKGTLDTLEVQVELDDETFSSTVKKIEAHRRKLARAIESTLGISVKITLLGHGTLARSEGKAQRVTDLRKKD